MESGGYSGFDTHVIELEFHYLVVKHRLYGAHMCAHVWIQNTVETTFVLLLIHHHIHTYERPANN